MMKSIDITTVLVFLCFLITGCAPNFPIIVFKSGGLPEKYYSLKWGNEIEIKEIDFSLCEGPSWSPNKKFIACSFWHKPLQIMDDHGDVLETITNSEYYFSPSSWSPDNTYLAMMGSPIGSGNDAIFSVKIDGTELARLSNNPDTLDVFPQWSPDGKYILYRSIKFKNEHQAPQVVFDNLVIITPDAQEVFRFDLGRINGFELGSLPGVAANWSPDSKKLGAFGWYIIDIQTNKTMNLMPQNNTLCTHSPPTWSPDGRMLLFQATSCDDHNPNNSYDIYTIDVNGTNFKKLTNTEMALLPWWSPDGKYIVYDSNVTGNWDVYLMRADGSNNEDLTNSPNDEHFVDWLTP